MAQYGLSQRTVAGGSCVCGGASPVKSRHATRNFQSWRLLTACLDGEVLKALDGEAVRTARIRPSRAAAASVAATGGCGRVPRSTEDAITRL